MKKNNIKSIITWILIIGILVGAFFGIKYLFDIVDEKVDEVGGLVSPGENVDITGYTVGALTANGAPTTSANSFYTSKHFEADGLEIELKDESNLKFQVFYYDYDKVFVGSTEVLEENYSKSTPIYYVYARVMFITDADFQLQGYNLYNYVGDFTIKTSDTLLEERILALKNDYELYMQGGYKLGVISPAYGTDYYSEQIKINNIDGIIFKIPLIYYDDYQSIQLLAEHNDEDVFYRLNKLSFNTVFTDENYTYVFYDTSPILTDFESSDVTIRIISHYFGYLPIPEIYII